MSQIHMHPHKINSIKSALLLFEMFSVNDDIVWPTKCKTCIFRR